MKIVCYDILQVLSNLRLFCKVRKKIFQNCSTSSGSADDAESNTIKQIVWFNTMDVAGRSMVTTVDGCRGNGDKVYHAGGNEEFENLTTGYWEMNPATQYWEVSGVSHGYWPEIDE